jgi:hypothetical protein
MCRAFRRQEVQKAKNAARKRTGYAKLTPDELKRVETTALGRWARMEAGA